MMNTESDIPTELFDRFFIQHRIKKVLGAGGQGMVVSTKTPNIAAKIVLDEAGRPITKETHPEQFERAQAAFEGLVLMPLPDGINVARPLTLLESHAGYVMRIMDDMQPLSGLDSLLAVPENITDYPVWIVGSGDKNKPEPQHQQLYVYCKSGGLRRRLELLTRCACVLAELHSSGLVYGDLSPNNIFVTEDPTYAHQNIWLIDSDNISIASFDNSIGSGVYTPRYGAPEVVTGQAKCSQDSDVYSFAIIAFELLAMLHPFWGDAIEGVDSNNDWDQSDSGINSRSDIETKALEGKLPWVDCQDDDTNSTNNGLPRPLVLSQELQMAFDTMFTKGKIDTGKRLPAIIWPRLFARLADTTIACGECEMSWPGQLEIENCPYCNASLPDVLTLLDDSTVCFMREIDSNKAIEIPMRVLLPFDVRLHGTPGLTIHLTDYSEHTELIVSKPDQAFKADISCEVVLGETVEPVCHSIMIELDTTAKDNLYIVLKEGGRTIRRLKVAIQEAK
ncbi:protein kinase domain-containing protein [Spirochaeta dissipatitropha]